MKNEPDHLFLSYGTTIPEMAKILIGDAGENEPNLLISCFGGAKYFKMSHKLEKNFMDAIGEMAATKGKFTF